MGKINKYANIYTKDGDLLRHVDDHGVLKSMTIKELEDLLDKLVNDRDDDGNIKDPNAVNNVQAVLYQKYQQNPKHVQEMFKEMAEKVQNEAPKKTTAEEIQKAMEELKKEVESTTEDSMDKYVDFEEVNENEQEKAN